MDYGKFPNLRPEVQDSRVLAQRSVFVDYYESDDKGEPTGKTPIVTLHGLNTKFTVTENIGNFYPKAQIGVCNVKATTRDFLTNYMNFSDLHYSKRVLRLYAGYLQPGEDWHKTPYLFGGNIMYTRFTEPPDIWLNMEVLYKNRVSALTSQEWTLKGTQTSETVLRESAKRLNLGLDIRDMPPYSFTNFTATGDGKALLRQLRYSMPNYAVFVNNGALTVIARDRKRPAPGETIWQVREDTGMIGIPVVETWGVELTTLLNPNMHPGDWVNLVSQHQPAASGIYIILSITHSGELRGKEFYTKIQAYYPDPDKRQKK